MKKTFFCKTVVALLFLLPLSLFAKEVRLSAADTDRSICLEVGDTLKVVLQGNPTTGYTWNLSPLETHSLSLVEKSYKPSSSRCGAGGTYTFTFSAISKGTTTLVLTNSRSWEKGIPPIQTFESTVEVQ